MKFGHDHRSSRTESSQKVAKGILDSSEVAIHFRMIDLDVGDDSSARTKIEETLLVLTRLDDEILASSISPVSGFSCGPSSGYIFTICSPVKIVDSIRLSASLKYLSLLVDGT
jgi:hypothetical protein